MNPTTNGTQPRVEVNPFGMPSRMILLGYYDGPTEGVIQFQSGSVYRFLMPDEERQLSRQSFPRDYALHPLPADALDRLEAVLAEHLTPLRPARYVNWQFESPDVERDTDRHVATILGEAAPAAWLVTLPAWTFEDFNPIRIVSLQPA
jgi:hypothetical protein